MGMAPHLLGDAMIRAWQGVEADDTLKKNFGDRMYDAMMSINMDQGSVADGQLARKRFHAVAGEIFDHMMDRHSQVPERRMKALATVIIEHIQKYATIEPLGTTSTPNDGAAPNRLLKFFPE